MKRAAVQKSGLKFREFRAESVLILFVFFVFIFT